MGLTGMMAMEHHGACQRGANRDNMDGRHTMGAPPPGGPLHHTCDGEPGRHKEALAGIILSVVHL